MLHIGCDAVFFVLCLFWGLFGTITEKRSRNVLETEKFNPHVKYTDSYYENYISAFDSNLKKRIFFRFVKRTFDFLVSFLMLLLLSPIYLILAIAVKLDSKGPVIFRQERMGKDGKTFTCLKFRSMYTEAPHDLATSLFHDASSYLTRVGRFMRKFSLDELPQIWCVFIGKMSFIGYRPLILNESECNDMRRRLGVFRMRPGISGYSQVSGRDDLYYKNKAILDAEYVKHASLFWDFKLLLKTVIVVANKKGNHTCLF